MRRISPLSAAIVTAVLWGSAVEASGPVALVDEPVVDVGVVYRGQKVDHRFTIRNDGDLLLEIDEVEPSCGCTVAEHPASIPPGGSGTIRAVLDTEGFQGPIAKSVRVLTNDPGNPRIHLIIKANVKTRLELEPVYARFIAVVGERQEPSSHILWSPDWQELEVSKVDSPYRFLEATFRPASETEAREGVEGRQWRIDLTLAPDAPVGPLADHVRVHTNHPGQEVVKIPVSGFVRPVLDVSPPVADFGRRELGVPFTASLEVRTFSSEAIAVTAVETDLEAIEAEFKQVKAGRHYEIRLELTPGMPEGEFQGKLRIRTSSPRQPLLEVDIKGSVLAADTL